MFKISFGSSDKHHMKSLEHHSSGIMSETGEFEFRTEFSVGSTDEEIRIYLTGWNNNAALISGLPCNLEALKRFGM